MRLQLQLFIFMNLSSLASMESVKVMTSMASQTLKPSRSFHDGNIGSSAFISHSAGMCLRQAKHSSLYSAKAYAPPPKAKPTPLPVVLGPIGAAPLLPGALERLAMPSPGQIQALQTSITFASLDSTFGSR